MEQPVAFGRLGAQPAAHLHNDHPLLAGHAQGANCRHAHDFVLGEGLQLHHEGLNALGRLKELDVDALYIPGRRHRPLAHVLVEHVDHFLPDGGFDRQLRQLGAADVVEQTRTGACNAFFDPHFVLRLDGGECLQPLGALGLGRPFHAQRRGGADEREHVRCAGGIAGRIGRGQHGFDIDLDALLGNTHVPAADRRDRALEIDAVAAGGLRVRLGELHLECEDLRLLAGLLPHEEIPLAGLAHDAGRFPVHGGLGDGYVAQSQRDLVPALFQNFDADIRFDGDDVLGHADFAGGFRKNGGNGGMTLGGTFPCLFGLAPELHELFVGHEDAAPLLLERAPELLVRDIDALLDEAFLDRGRLGRGRIRGLDRIRALTRGKDPGPRHEKKKSAGECHALSEERTVRCEPTGCASVHCSTSYVIGGPKAEGTRPILIINADDRLPPHPKEIQALWDRFV